MRTLKEEVTAKLSHIFHDIKDLQKTVIIREVAEKSLKEERSSKWGLLGREVSDKWKGCVATDEIREQREKTW